jgi:methionyl-tRNA synthetase
MLPTPRASRIVRRSMPKPFFITTAIDYTNGAPHIGHAYEKVLADVLARYHRLKGDEVFYLTGVDQHGQKVQQSAEKAGLEPQAYVDGITAKFTALWEKLDVKYSAWAATTDPLHKECVRANLQKLWDDKDPATGESRWIYKKTQRGFYSVRQEQFLTDKERGPDGQFGPEWGVVEERDEENFYFRLTQAPAAPGQDPATGLPGCDPKQWLLDFIDKRSADGKPFVVPDFRVAELRNAVEKLEGDLCISRPASRLKWGIPFPESFGAGFVTYVWFDALVNYITYVPGHDSHFSASAGLDPTILEDMFLIARGMIAKGIETFADFATETASEFGEWVRPYLKPAWDKVEKFFDELHDAESKGSSESGAGEKTEFAAWWPPLHVIGKDILIPAHGVYWPIMLKALGFTDEEMPTLLVHGWWNIAGAKMSKSLGNIVDPDLLADKYGPEALRYYLMSDIATGRDADFSEERLVQRYNTDLANSLGNLLNRTLNMAAKYREGKICFPSQFQNEPLVPGESRFYIAIQGPIDLYKGNIDPKSEEPDRWDGFHIDAAINDGPIKLAVRCNGLIETTAPWKLAKDPAQAERLDAVLYTLAESLRIIAILIWPVLPDAAHGIFDQLAWKLDEAGKDTRFRLADAVWGGLPDGHILGKPVPLFPRIEVPAPTAEK